MSIIAKKKKGDTLVEVAFAIGVFSLVAVTVVSVISASTSATQAALEATLTREDIDGQAEALRFIHDSYINGIQSAKNGDNPYEELWKKITELAYKDDDNYRDDYPVSELKKKYIKEYSSVTSCDDLYNKQNGGLHNLVSSQGNSAPFIINIRNLNLTEPNKVIVTGTGNNKFQPTTTYPRILYGSDESLLSQTQNSGTAINRVEGLYIVAVKGQKVNVIEGTNSESKPAYYDFYIRSCWMPTNAEQASTISTLVRLYDPNIINS